MDDKNGLEAYWNGVKCLFTNNNDGILKYNNTPREIPTKPEINKNVFIFRVLYGIRIGKLAYITKKIMNESEKAISPIMAHVSL